jgi:outer membrane protein assembly factor BamB
MFRANFQRNGFYKTPSIRQIEKVKWQFGQSVDLMSLTSVKSKNFIIEDGVVCLEGYDNNIYGLDVDRGKQIWQLQLDKQKKIDRQGYAAKNGIFYLRTIDLTANNSLSLNEDYLYAIDILSGRINWKVKIPFQSSSLSFNYSLASSSPIVYNNSIYLGGHDGRLYELEIDSGKAIWNFKTDLDMSISAIALENYTLCFCSNDGYLYAIDLVTKTPIWKFEISSIFADSFFFPSINDGVVYIVDADRVLNALELTTGRILWTFNLNNQQSYYPAINDLYVCIVGEEKYLHILDKKTGEEICLHPLGYTHCLTGFALTDNTIYLSAKGFIEALDLETGKQLWRMQTPQPKNWLFNPSLLASRILDRLSKAVNDRTINLEQFSEPAIADGVIYATCTNGYLYALQ